MRAPEMTVYEFATKLMNDSEFNRGGIIPNERDYLDAIGFDYRMSRGCIAESGKDLTRFYDAMYILKELNDKYKEA